MASVPTNVNQEGAMRRSLRAHSCPAQAREEGLGELPFTPVNGISHLSVRGMKGGRFSGPHMGEEEPEA